MALIFCGIKGKGFYLQNCCAQGAELELNAIKIKMLNFTPKEDYLLMFNNNIFVLNTVLLIWEITSVSYLKRNF